MDDIQPRKVVLRQKRVETNQILRLQHEIQQLGVKNKALTADNGALCKQVVNLQEHMGALQGMLGDPQITAKASEPQVLTNGTFKVEYRLKFENVSSMDATLKVSGTDSADNTIIESQEVLITSKCSLDVNLPVEITNG